MCYPPQPEDHHWCSEEENTQKAQLNLHLDVSCWQIKLRTANYFVAVLCHCFVTMVVWGGGLLLIDEFHYIKIFLLGSWLGEIKQKKYIIHNLLSLKMISFVLFPYALVLSLYFDILKLFLVMYRAANKFCFLKGAMSDEKCCWTQSRMHYDSFMRILQGRHGTRKDNWLHPDIHSKMLFHWYDISHAPK